MALMRRDVQLRDGFPVVPGGFPLIGHMPSLWTKLSDFHLNAKEQLGPLYWVDTGFGSSQLYYSHPDAVQLFKTKAANSSYMRDSSIDLLGDSVILLDGPPHLKARSALNPSFTPKGLMTGNVGAVVSAVMLERAERWVKQSSLMIVPETREIALDIIFRLIGIPSTDLALWRKTYEEFLWIVINLPINLPGFPKWRGKRAARWLEERLGALVRAARQKETAENLLERLALAVDEDGNQMAEPQLIDNIRLLALAGHETTASTMAWMAIHLAQEPKWWEAIVEEARSVGQPPMSPAELRRFPVAEAIFRECVRLHPPIPGDARVVVGNLELEGKQIPMGTILGIPMLALYRDPQSYPDPHEFRPDRWLGKDIPTPLDTIAFGSGAHFCLGYHVAWMEAVHFGARLALTFSEAGKKLVPPPVVKERFVPFLQPSPGIKLQVL